MLKPRVALRQLLQDVLGQPEFKAILVYDVSRWGRFQDSDESAHYEFLCKKAGVPVHYCAEAFANDGSIPSSIMKALKRTMAAEYSRELGVKVLAGQKRLATLGFKQGGIPGYGLRRVLVSSDRVVKQELASGERKSIATDRVILALGPPDEVQCVREIYQMLLSGKCVYAIARELNRRGTIHPGAKKWDYLAVHTILTNVKYAGHHVFGRTSARLYTPAIRLPVSKWTITPGAFEAIVDQTTFETAQRILHERTINKSNADLLDALSQELVRHGRLSLNIIENSPILPTPSTYIRRFGSLRSAYEKIGYGHASDYGRVDMRGRTLAMRRDLMNRIAALFPEQVSIISKGGRWRMRFQLRRGLMVSVLIVRSVRVWGGLIRWQVDPAQRERKLITLVARLDTRNEKFMDFHIVPNIDRRGRFTLKLRNKWLGRGLALKNMSEFCKVVERVSVLKKILVSGGTKWL